MSRQAEPLHVTMGAPTSHTTYLPRNKTTRTDYGTRGPKYKGLNTFKRVLMNNEKLTGCTVHYVNEKLDSGKIILKKKIFIESNDNEETLKAKVQAKEHRAYSESIINIFRLINL